MYVELSTNDPAIIHKAIAEATPGLTSEEVLRATISRGQTGDLYHLSLSTSKWEREGGASERPPAQPTS